MRITGGTHRSRPLSAPKGDRTRPTSDRVREALFAIVLSRRSLEGAKVLDLYAGTGALGLEALSRGAAFATLVESSRSAVEAIRANVAALRLETRARVVSSSVERARETLSKQTPFDVVFADPPYADVASGVAAKRIGELIEAGILAEDGMLVLEHGKNEGSPGIALLSLSEARRYGDTVLSFYARGEGGHRASARRD